MQDRIVKSLKEKKLVFWEEVARDGAQAKILLTGEQRVKVAKANAALFNENGPDHLVFAAGFPSIGKEEFEVIRYVADNVDSCYVVPNGRAFKEEIELCLNSVKGTKYPRIAFFVPMSENLADVIMHKNLKEVEKITLDIARFALDKANGIPVDIQLAAAAESDPSFIADVALKLTEEGISTIGIGDSFGKIYPNEMMVFLDKLIEKTDDRVLFSTHFHNDLCFSLCNNIQAIKRNIRLITTSWLGLGERNGLLPTEQLLFLMSYEAEKLEKRLGIKDNELFYSKPNIKGIVDLAKLISNFTEVPLKITDPLVGTGVNTLSTGTPFVNTLAFQPFDTEKVLGVKQEVFVTQLASKRLVVKVAKDLNFDLNEEQIVEALKYIKSETYRRGKAVIPNDELIKLFKKISGKNMN